MASALILPGLAATCKVHNLKSVKSARTSWLAPATLPLHRPLTTHRALQARLGKARRSSLAVFASGDENKPQELLEKGMKVGQGVVDNATKLVPESVPRPVAKVGVTVVGLLLMSWAVQSLISTVLGIAVMGGGAYLVYNIMKNEEGGDDGDGDALQQARKIMDKYK